MEFVREVRFLKLYAIASTTLMVAVAGGSLVAQNQRQKFTEIDVERINIVEPNGRIALVLANTQRLPGIFLEGKELPKQLSQGREGSAGMLFIDAQGTEIGGLTYRLDLKGDGTYSASRNLTFDQHNQDQVVGLQYFDNGKTRAYGLSVWDRPSQITLKDILEGVKDATDRKAVEERFRQLAKERGVTTGGARRVFVGSQDQTAALRIADPEGRDRVRIIVEPTGASRMEFLDEKGTVIRTIP